MNGNREKLWTPEIWSGIDNAVLEEVGRIRVTQKVFPTMQTPAAATVHDESINAGPPFNTTEGLTKAFLEIFAEFSLTQAQVENEASMQTARKLARTVSRVVAQAEDLVLLQGQTATLPSGVTVNNLASAGAGILGSAIKTVAKGSGSTSSIYNKIIDAMHNDLEAAGHPGPFALILSPPIFSEAYGPFQSSSTTIAERLIPLLPGGFYSCGALTIPAKTGKPAEKGILCSLGGSPTNLFIAQDTTVDFNQQDLQGNYRFRVFERIQFVVREGASLVQLNF